MTSPSSVQQQGSGYRPPLFLGRSPRGHRLSAQGIDLLLLTNGPRTPWDTPPPPAFPGGVTAHVCQSFPQFLHTVASLPPTPGQDYAYQQPCNDPSAYAYTHSAPRDFAGDQQGIYHTAPTSQLGGEGEVLEWPRYILGHRTLYPRVWHPPVVIMGPRHPLQPSLLVPTATPAPGLVTGTLVLRTCAIMGSRAGKTS